MTCSSMQEWLLGISMLPTELQNKCTWNIMLHNSGNSKILMCPVIPALEDRDNGGETRCQKCKLSPVRRKLVMQFIQL